MVRYPYNSSTLLNISICEMFQCLVKRYGTEAQPMPLQLINSIITLSILTVGCESWSSWSSWTGCSRTCGTGMRSRTRRCHGGDGSTQDEMVGCMMAECPFPTTQPPPVTMSTTSRPGEVSTTQPDIRSTTTSPTTTGG